jgi:hypothetical protein
MLRDMLGVWGGWVRRTKSVLIVMNPAVGVLPFDSEPMNTCLCWKNSQIDR